MQNEKSSLESDEELQNFSIILQKLFLGVDFSTSKLFL